MNIRGRGIVDSSGHIRISMDSVPSSREYLVERIRVWTSSTTETYFALYEETEDPGNVLDCSDTGNDDIGLEEPAIRVASGVSVIGLWTGASLTDSNGDPTRAVLTLQVREQRA